MYRMVNVEPSQRNFQRILWRSNPNERVHEYTLNTVTYGTAAAPHLAVRALQQCAKDNGDEYPLASVMVHKHFYVDDFLGGADTVAEALEVYKQVNEMLAKGSFVMSKWCSNSLTVASVVGGIDARAKHPLGFDELETSVLGVRWHPCGDVFTFNIGRVMQITEKTKRAIIGQIGRFFDPHGFAAPVIILAKIIIQDIWRAEVNWDDLVPQSIACAWEQFVNTLPEMESINIPRWTGMSHSCRDIQIHGFADASTKAYAAVVYVRCVANDGSISVSLLAAKTKVAPLKKISVPRLELNAAQLLAKLMSSIMSAFAHYTVKSFCWSDNEPVLHWIHRPSSDSAVFVANRVNEIQITTMEKGVPWLYVPTDVNPADIASRGCMPSVLSTTSEWWSGPKFLKSSECKWPEQNWRSYELPLDLMELRAAVRTVAITMVNSGCILKNNVHILDCYSKLNTLVNVMGWTCRFINNVKAKSRGEQITGGALSPEEKLLARRHLYKMDQQRCFPEEIDHIQKQKAISKTSALLRLHPMMDQHGILRLNGRLMNAAIQYDAKFPIVLSHKGAIAPLLLRQAHIATMHGGVQQVLQYVRQEFWITRSRNMASATIHGCNKCFRYNMKTENQLMGQLPELRITPARAFERVGIDYCGPFMLKAYTGRCKIITKAYVAVFVCLVTRAIHLELVTNMTSDAFLDAYYRFVARRGQCSFILTDNGTTFVGAKSTLEKIRKTLMHLRESGVTKNDFAKWCFITPAAPHQGGIWEAAVKSFKRHLVRCVGETQMTYEEYSTLLCFIEASLNSRPIARLNDDPNDLLALTPGHFLIGAPLVVPPHEHLSETPRNRLNRHDLVQQYQQHIWRRWQNEYLHTLLNRPKWVEQRKNIEIGDLVVVKTDNMLPSRWSIGRVIELFPGEDGLVRNVAVKMSTGTYRRPIQKLAVLPKRESEIID